MNSKLPRWRGGKEPACQCRRDRFNPWVRKIPWRREWEPTPIFLPGKCNGEMRLVGYTPWGHKGVRHDFSSVQFSLSVVSDSLRSHGLHHTRLSCPLPTPRAYSNSCSSSQWCHPTISSSVVPFSCLQSFPASGSFWVQKYQFFIRMT